MPELSSSGRLGTVEVSIEARAWRIVGISPMASQDPRGTADPKLVEQLDAASARDESVEAVVSLRPDEGTELVSVERTDELAHDVVNRVERMTGLSPERLNVFGNLGSFVVAARAQFVSELLAQPEVEAATANRRGTPVVEPLGSKGPEEDG